MKTWKIIRIWRLSAVSRGEALRKLHHAEEASEPISFYFDEFAVEDRPKGFFEALVKQVLG